jgi:hypothetical protein
MRPDFEVDQEREVESQPSERLLLPTGSSL